MRDGFGWPENGWGRGLVAFEERGGLIGSPENYDRRTGLN